MQCALHLIRAGLDLPMPQFHTREVAAGLLDKPVNTFAAERQRGEMPAVWRGDHGFILSEAGAGVTQGAEAEARRGYTTQQVFLALIRDEFVREFKMDKKAAAGIAQLGARLFTSDNWTKIAAGSLAIFEGCAPAAEVVFGRINLVNGASLSACGVLDDRIFVGLSAPVESFTFINATRAAAKLRERAHRDGIDLGDFWEPPPAQREKGSQRERNGAQADD
jgi:hypothetical protein